MDKAEKVMEKVLGFLGQGFERFLIPLVEKLIGLAMWLLPFVIFGYSCYYGYKWALQFYIESQANEWLIIIRNGEMVKKGIGLCTWKMPYDQHVKFPSLIN